MALFSHYPEPYKDVPATQLLMERSITKHGWLMKKSNREKFTLSPKGNYDKRFFIILKGWVYYYKSKDSDKPQGHFSLKGYSSNVTFAEEESLSSLPYVFKVFPKSKDDRTWYLAPESESEMRDWKNAFKCEIEKYNIKSSNLRSSVSMPEKGSPHHRFPLGVNMAEPRSQSSRLPKKDENQNPLPHGGDSMMSMNTQDSGVANLNSSSEFDLYEQYDEDHNGSYRPLPPQPSYTEEQHYLDPDEVNPITSPQHTRSPVSLIPGTAPMMSPSDFAKRNRFVPHASGSSLIPERTNGPPVPLRSPPPQGPEYDVIDEKHPIFQSPSSRPMSVPHLPPKPEFMLPLKREPIVRTDSFPDARPPDPPLLLSSQVGYEMLRQRILSAPDYPLPQAPQQANSFSPKNTARSETALFGLTYQHGASVSYPMTEESISDYTDTAHPDDIEVMYDDTAHGSLTEDDQNMIPSVAEMLDRKVALKPDIPNAAAKRLNLPVKPHLPTPSHAALSSGLIHAQTPKPATPAKPKLTQNKLKSSTETNISSPSKPSNDSIKPPTPEKSWKPKPPTPSKPSSGVLKPSTTERLEIKNKPPTTNKPTTVPLKPTTPMKLHLINKPLSGLTIETSKPKAFSMNSEYPPSSYSQETNIFKNLRSFSQATSTSSPKTANVKTRFENNSKAQNGETEPAAVSVLARAKMFGDKVPMRSNEQNSNSPGNVNQGQNKFYMHR